MFARFLLGVALVFASGCSLVLVDGPPDYIPASDPVPPEACTIDRTFPLLDAVGTGIALAAVLWSSEGDAVRYGAVSGVALGFSSYTGFRRVNHCRARILPTPNTPPPDILFPRARVEIADPLPGAPGRLAVTDGLPGRSR